MYICIHTHIYKEWLSSKRQEKANAGKHVEKRVPLCIVGGIVNWYSHYGNSKVVPQIIKNRTTILYSNSTSGCTSEGNKISIMKTYLHSHAHCSIIHSSQDMETTYLSING